MWRKTQEFFDRYGNRAIVLGRFVPIVRTFITVMAGVGRMDPRRYLTYSLIGGVAWAAGVTLLGYWLGQFAVVKANIELMLIAIVCISVLPMIIEVLRARRGRRTHRPGRPERLRPGSGVATLGVVNSGAVTTLALPFLGEAGPATVWVVVLVFVFLECAFIIGLFLPGDSLLIAAGVLLAEHGHESGAWVLGGVATAVAVAGNQVGYLIGRYTGTRMLARKEGRVLNRANLARATAFFERWGFWAIVVAPVDPLDPHARADDRRSGADGQPPLHHGERGRRGVLGADADPARVLRSGPARHGAVAADHRRRCWRWRGSCSAAPWASTASGRRCAARSTKAPRTPKTPSATRRPLASGRGPTTSGPPERPDTDASAGALHRRRGLQEHPRRELHRQVGFGERPGRGVRAGRRQSWANTGPPPVRVSSRSALPGRVGARQHERGGERGELGAAERGVGEVAGQDPVEQPAVAAVVVARDDPVRAGHGGRSRPGRRRRVRPTAGRRRRSASSTHAPRWTPWQ